LRRALSTAAVLALALALALALHPRQALASNPADLCRSAASAAATETGVPGNVLVAITLTETGRSLDGRLQPWPWTVNEGGEGHWFPDRATAEGFAEALLRAGRTSFDVGCFQINYRWHGQAFDGVSAMFDPDRNARHAARFLADLAAEGGTWSDAAGAYHSRTAELAARYRTRFDTILASLEGGGPTPAPGGAAPAEAAGSRYSHPLLQARDAPRSPGSLVPLAPVPAT
jgi:hypothetical protein